jgi:glycosyltransferase involved in cell wall biosynthesis
MINYNKDEVTIILPCHNESLCIKAVVENFKNAGFHNILVVDDASNDETGKMAQLSNAEVIKNYKCAGFYLAMLRGLYSVRTKYAFVAYSYEELVSIHFLNQFVEFGIIGNYSLLISRDESEKAIKLSCIIKKKFGIFIHEPSFDFVFMDRKLIDVIKKEVGGTGQYAYLEIIKTAIENKLKLGSYPIGLSNTLRMSSRRFRRNKGPKAYFRYAVPDTNKMEVIKNFSYIVISLLTIIVTILLAIGGKE